MWLHIPHNLGVPMVERKQYGLTTATSSRYSWWGGSRWLHDRWPFGVPIVGRNRYGCITRAFLGPPWWRGINVATRSNMVS